MKNISRLDSLALSILNQQADPVLSYVTPMGPVAEQFGAPEPIRASGAGAKIKMATPESDFMETIEVDEGSPQHIKLLRQAAAMEPGGPEAKYMRLHGIK